VKASVSVESNILHPGKRWSGVGLSVASILAMSACTLDSGSEDTADDGDTGELVQELSANPCTAVKLTAPTQHFSANVGVPLVISATAVCPAGQTPEFQYWFKSLGAANWTFIMPYFPGAVSLLPLATGAFCFTAVVRATGAPENYQARANARCGTIIP
jgi:hypothetical protein